MLIFQTAIFAVLLGTVNIVSAQAVLTGTNAPSSTVLSVGDGPPESGRSYRSYGSTVTVEEDGESSFGSMTALESSMGAANATFSTNTTSARPTSVTLLVGTPRKSSASPTAGTNSTSSSTSVSPQATNKTPCNGHPSFCARKFSNITYVAAHNSPFSRPDNAASNQQLDVEFQLEDGIRMLQFQTHWNESLQTFQLCHSSCDILNMGTLEPYMERVTRWLRNHPYDVITILMGNSDNVSPDKYVQPLTSSGLFDYVYIPPKTPMSLDDWPELQQMIFANTRAVVMLDYGADQQQVPWLLDEFGMMWETPFSPTDREFPCTADRPPEDWAGALPREQRMYMANHNLNVLIAFGGISLLVPNTPILNETNAATESLGSLKTNSLNCTKQWDRPPNFLLVDYYNIGDYNGSVFQVAAEANNVSYDRSTCCGRQAANGAPKISSDLGIAPCVGTLMVVILYFLG